MADEAEGSGGYVFTGAPITFNFDARTGTAEDVERILEADGSLCRIVVEESTMRDGRKVVSVGVIPVDRVECWEARLGD